jgi:hypothetical protein
LYFEKSKSKVSFITIKISSVEQINNELHEDAKYILQKYLHNTLVAHLRSMTCQMSSLDYINANVFNLWLLTLDLWCHPGLAHLFLEKG